MSQQEEPIVGSLGLLFKLGHKGTYIVPFDIEKDKRSLVEGGKIYPSSSKETSDEVELITCIEYDNMRYYDTLAALDCRKFGEDLPDFVFEGVMKNKGNLQSVTEKLLHEYHRILH